MTNPSPPTEITSFATCDRSIGDLIREACGLSDAQIEQILLYQREHHLRFGEAAMALHLASSDDVIAALSQQFHYPYVPGQQQDAAPAELITAANPFSEEAEAFRELRSQLLMDVLAVPQTRALAVLSPDVGDGKTYFAANLAVAFSQLGGKTLLIDADLRTPRQHKLLGIEHQAGLSSVLSGRAESNVIHRTRNLASLFLMPAGPVPPNPLELLQRPAFGLLLLEMLGKFDHVIVDTPAGVHGADGRVIAAKAGAAVVIGRGNHSRMSSMQRLLDSLRKAPVALAGVVMNEH